MNEIVIILICSGIATTSILVAWILIEAEARKRRARAELDVAECMHNGGAYVEVRVLGMRRFLFGLYVMRIGAWICGVELKIIHGDEHENR